MGARRSGWFSPCRPKASLTTSPHRILDPCDDGNCNWIDNPKLYMTTRRWYPTLETLEDGSAIILGGCEYGGYVNSANQDNPTYEYWPSKGEPIKLNILADSMPVNLFPLTWLLPSGNLFIQAEFKAEIFDYKSNTEYYINDIPDAVRVYPASGATAMFPMTPANNWTSTIIFCGGTDLQSTQWVTNWPIASYPASTSCVKITPDVDITWQYEDALDTGRTMGQVSWIAFSFDSVLTCSPAVHQPSRRTTLHGQWCSQGDGWIRE
jgi:hypothetical protein